MATTSKETCLCIDLRSAAQKLTQMYDEVMAPAGITVTQFSQLHLILTLDERPIGSFDSFAEAVRSSEGKPLDITYARDGEIQAVAPIQKRVETAQGIV